MRIRINKESNSLYFRLDESRIVESEEIRPGVVLDFDENDKVIGIEFLNISSRATEEELSNLQSLTHGFILFNILSRKSIYDTCGVNNIMEQRKRHYALSLRGNSRNHHYAINGMQQSDRYHCGFESTWIRRS